MLEKILELDKESFLFINGDGGAIMDSVMWALSSKLTYVILVIVFLVLMRIVKDATFRNLFFILASMALIVLLADQTSNFFNDYFCKLRPTHNPEIANIVHIVNNYRGGQYGTVSAHAANGFGIGIFMTLTYRERWFSWSVMGFFTLIAFSRIYLSVHYPLDILLGIFFGLLYGFIVYKLYKKFYVCN